MHLRDQETDFVVAVAEVEVEVAFVGEVVDPSTGTSSVISVGNLDILPMTVQIPLAPGEVVVAATVIDPRGSPGNSSFLSFSKV